MNEAQRVGMMSSATPEWATPRDLFDSLDAEFGFTVDVCAVPENAKCERYFTPECDGLAQDWTGACWMNPPYGRGIGAWIRKAYESSLGGATVVCLVPARTDTAWWHDYCARGEVRFLRGRVKFGGAKWNAPFPSAVVIFRSYYDSAEVRALDVLSHGRDLPVECDAHNTLAAFILTHRGGDATHS